MPGVKPVPEGIRSLTPHLVCKDAFKAIEFCKRAFGAEELSRLAGRDGKPLHAAIRIGDSTVMSTDELPDWVGLGPKSLGGSPVTLRLYVEDADALVERPVDVGAKITMPLAVTFWGDH